MYYILATLHTILNPYPLGMKLAVIGILALGWILGRTSAEYTEALKRPSANVMILAGLCAHLTVLLCLIIIADSIWLHNYSTARLVAALLLGIVVVAGICQRVALHTAHQIVLDNGYERGRMPIVPKQRGS